MLIGKLLVEYRLTQNLATRQVFLIVTAEN